MTAGCIAFDRRKQKGAIIVFLALCMTFLVSLLAVVDVGFMYLTKREFQKSADLAAMAGANRLAMATGVADPCAAATAAAEANAQSNLNQPAIPKGITVTVTCGEWNPALGADPFDTSADAALNAVRVTVSGEPFNFFMSNLLGIENHPISAEATAAANQAIAQLAIRSTLASIDTERSRLLNAVVGGLLGGKIELEAFHWEGLLNSEVDLLTYLDFIALELELDVGSYDQVLGSQVALGDLLGAAVNLLEQAPNQASGSTKHLGDALSGLLELLELRKNVDLPGLSPLLSLGELLGISTGTPVSALDLGLNLLDLVQGGAMLANGSNVVDLELPVVIPGVASVKLQVIEPTQKSVVGNPTLARIDPLGSNRIFIRTAQVKLLVSARLETISGLLNSITTALSPLLGPVVGFLSNLGHDNLLESIGELLEQLLGAIARLTCILSCELPWSESKIVYAEVAGSSIPLQISLEAGGAEAYVTDYDCSGGERLSVGARTSLATLRIGQMSEEAIFGNSLLPPTVEPVPLVELGYRKVRARLSCDLLWINCFDQQQWWTGHQWSDDHSAAQKFSLVGLGLKLDSSENNSIRDTGVPRSLNFSAENIPDVGQEPIYQSLSSSRITQDITQLITNIDIRAYSSPSPGLLGALLSGSLGLLSGLISTLQATLDGVLTAILTPMLNELLPMLGIELANADVGANLTCQAGATLVD